MDKQTIPFIVLCILLMVFWGPIMDWVWPPKPAAHPPRADRVSTVSQTNETALPSLPPTPGTLSRLAKAEASIPPQTATLENDRMRVEFTNLGGGIGRVILKQFSENGGGVVVLNDQSPFPLMSAVAGDAAWCDPYQWTVSSNQLHAVYQSPAGLQISKEYTLEPDYQISARLTLKNAGRAAFSNATLQVALGMSGPLDARDQGDFIGLSFLSGNKAFHETVATLQKQAAKQQKPFEKIQPIEWAAVRNQFFTILTTPSTPFAAIQAEPFALTPRPEPDAVKSPYGVLALIHSTPFQLAPGASTNWTFAIYAGPKEYQKLSSLGKRQDQVLDFGMFEIFCKALLWLMGLFHGVFHNWGVAILVVTVVIKILFWPLTAMSTKSMKQMQALAPQMNALKEKYKDNPKKMNEETMKMYRDYKINPMAGCLPMVVQIPIFIAFYNLLRTAIELRGAPFILWIRDLSAPDTVAYLPGTGFPINPLPLIMSATMIWQTKLTPQAPNTDPSMKMMMWFMPAMFLFFCYNFSSGLSLYWTAQNLLTILQTYLTKNKSAPPPQKVKSGGGFTFCRPVETRKK